MTWTDSSQAWDWVGHGLAEIFDEPGRETRDSTLASAPRSYCARQTVRMQAPKRIHGTSPCLLYRDVSVPASAICFRRSVAQAYLDGRSLCRLADPATHLHRDHGRGRLDPGLSIC
ncbi:hypothetical protein ColKHC_00624 [Colletotrichum higginsianum]|nr:hypothetical protein ColKHC_00624 [Colletotrichum higginsianum]